jgi:hypothetical protein
MTKREPPRFRDSPVICGRRFLTCYGGPIGTRDKSILYERWRCASHWYLIIKALDVQTVQEWVPMQFQYNNYKDITPRAGKTGDESIQHANTATTSATRLSRTGASRVFDNSAARRPRSVALLRARGMPLCYLSVTTLGCRVGR